ncbi:MAG: OmpA family protein [Acidobacteriota bacterium]
MTDKRVIIVCVLLAIGTMVSALVAQAAEPVQALQEVTEERQILALTYPEGPTISIEFQGTVRLPRSDGEAKVERKEGFTEIEIELDELKPAVYFGGDYNTYVLWVVSPEGHVDNLGEFVLNGNRSKLDVTTPLETFGMFVTAEPHFLVDLPSRFVVLENSRPTRDIAPLKISQLQYRGYAGIYNFERETLANMPEADDEVRADLEQARTSVELAVRAGAEQFAPEKLQEARLKLEETERAALTASAGNMMLLGKEVVRIAVDAQKMAQQQAFQAALDAERQTHQDETTRLAQAIEQAQSEADRARLEAQRRELELEMEARARAQAQRQALEAAQEASEAQRQAADARQKAEQARQEREEAREKMFEALSRVAETRETARGLIVSLPDILFDFNKAALKVQAREILSKISGILLVAQDYQLSVEGHTDGIGSDEYNLKLSRQRADSVHDYLVQAGLSPGIITTVGFGESKPVASNQTDEGRRQNRRVEIVILEGQTFTIEMSAR